MQGSLQLMNVLAFYTLYRLANTSEKYSKTFFTVAILSYSCGSNCQPMEPWSSTHFSSREMWRQNLPNGRVFSLPRAGSPHACTFFFKNLHLFTLLLISPYKRHTHARVHGMLLAFGAEVPLCKGRRLTPNSQVIFVIRLQLRGIMTSLAASQPPASKTRT